MGAFDDLIPARGGAPLAAAPAMARNAFADLIPASPAAAAAPADTFDPNDTSPAAYGGAGPDGRLRDAPSRADAAHTFAQTLDDYMGLAAKGLSFGLADRIGAAGDAAVGRGTYADNLANNRATLGREEAAHPIGAPVTELAAGAALPFGALGLAGRAATLGGRIGEGAMIGTGMGAVSGAAGSQDWRDAGQTVRDAGVGAITGGVIGTALPVAGAALGKAYSAAAPFFSRSPDGGRVASGILGNLMTPRAMGTLGGLGDSGMMADASPSLTNLAGGVTTRPGPGSDALVDALAARQAGQAGRLAADRNANLGPAFSPQQIGAMLDKSSTVSPLVEQANASSLPWNEQLADLSQRPAVAKALRFASDTAANSGNPLPMISLDETGREVSPSARAAYESYTANAVPRTQQALADLLGGGGALGTADDVMAQRAAASDPLYAQFRSSSIDTTPELQSLLQRPALRSALPAAETLAQNEGKTIYAPGSKLGDYEPDPTAPDVTPNEPAGFGDAPVADYAPDPRPTKPAMPRPQTLQDFVKAAGGVQDRGGDLNSLGFDSVPGLIAKPGHGLGQDAMRQVAAEAGYLGADTDHAMQNTSIGDLIDALGDHPVHSVRDQEAAAQWSAYDNARANFDRQGTQDSRSARPLQAPLDSLDAGAARPRARVPQITPEGWDYLKKALDDRIGTAQRTGKNNLVRVFGGLKSDLTDALDRQAPIYSEARQTFAGHSQMLDALKAGQAATKPGTTAEQVEREFAALGTDGERQMYRLGAGNTLRDMVGGKGGDADLARSVRGNLTIRSKLATLAPSPEALQQFHGMLDAQSHAFDEALRPDVRGWAMARDNLRQQQAKASGDQAAAIGSAADALDAQLHTIPAQMRADLTRQTANAGQQAFDTGRQVLRGGDDQPWPADLAAQLDKMPIEQQALLRAGARSDVEQRFGQNQNDLAALARLLGDSNDTNRAHMETLFGPESARAMGDALAREKTFANTNNRVAQNSATAGRLGGSKVIEDAAKAPEPFWPKDTTLVGITGHVVEQAARKAGAMISDAAGDKAREQLGRMLSLTGPERDRVFGGMAQSAATRAATAQALARLLAGPGAVSGVLAERRVGR